MKSKFSAALFANWFQKYLIYSLFTAYENGEWCRSVVHIATGSPSVISFYCVCFVSFYFFIFFFVSSITCWGIEVTQQTFVLMKTFWRRLQDVLIKTNMFALAWRLQGVFWRCLGQDQYIRLGHMSSRHLQDVFKTSLKHFQDVFMASSSRL